MKRCIIYGCNNHQGDGLFMGEICMPCYKMIVTGNDNPSENFIHRLHAKLQIISLDAKQAREYSNLHRKQLDEARTKLKLQDEANDILTKQRLEYRELLWIAANYLRGNFPDLDMKIRNFLDRDL